MRLRDVALVVFTGAWIFCAAVSFGEDVSSRARAMSSLWQKAAVDREVAAMVQEQEAKNLLLQADADKRADQTDAGWNPRDMLAHAGGTEWRAAEMQAAGAVNHEKCAQNWANSADQSRSVGDESAEKFARARANAALRRAFDAGMLAATYYERCAESFGPDAGNDAGRAGRASEKAAEWNERLALRGPPPD
jgi:hypothetical protein